MPTFVIERNIPGADKLTRDELKGISAKSCDVVAGLGVPYTWVTSYVAGDKIYCIHEADEESTIREHSASTKPRAPTSSGATPTKAVSPPIS